MNITHKARAFARIKEKVVPLNHIHVTIFALYLLFVLTNISDTIWYVNSHLLLLIKHVMTFYAIN